MRNKLYVMLVMSILAAAIAFAAGPDGQSGSEGQPDNTGSSLGSGNGTQVVQETKNQGEEDQVRTQEQTGNPGTGEQTRTQVQSGSIMMQGGKQVQVQVQGGDQIQLRSGNTEAQTSMRMSQEQTATGTKLQVQLSNGQNAEIKVMPDAAAEKALEQLRLRTCTTEEGCSIELKEVGKGDSAKAAYEIKSQKQAKVLGLFKAQLRVQAQIDAENGEVLQTKKQWWAFLASEPDE